MKYRMSLILAVAIVASAIRAFAGDGSDSGSGAMAASRPTAAEFEPMTRSERLSHYLTGLVDVESIFRAVASGGIHQAEGSPKEWGGGAQGYGYRVGDSFSRHVIRNTLEYGASAALHEDNRYFASGERGFGRRTRYAIASTFLARRDNGQRRISFSRLGGEAGAAFISRIWQPRSTSSAGDGATSFGISMATAVGFNVFREFWPDMKGHLRKR